MSEDKSGEDTLPSPDTSAATTSVTVVTVTEDETTATADAPADACNDDAVSGHSEEADDVSMRQGPGVLDACVELEEQVAVYCHRLASLAALWRQLASLGLAQGQLVRRVDVVLCTLDRVARQMLERTAQVGSKRQTVLQLTDNVAVSSHAVEARALELAEAERDSDLHEQQQASQVLAIHRLTQERRELEARLRPKVKALKKTVELLAEKEERLRRLQAVQRVVTDHCVRDMLRLEQQAEEAKTTEPLWRDGGDSLDVEKELRKLSIDDTMLCELDQEVTELRNQLHHLQMWGSEALQSKLLYCSRSRQLKQHIQATQGLLAAHGQQVRPGPRDSELQGFQDLPPPPADPSASDSQRAMDLLLADSAPQITAAQVERYLSQQFGFEIKGHYLMFCRLKEELGEAGLAYLAHKMSEGGSLHKDAANPTTVPAFADPAELRRVVLVLRDLAFQFRADKSLTESVLAPWTWSTANRSLASHPQSHPTVKAPAKRSKGKSKTMDNVPPGRKHEVSAPASKDKVESRSSFSRLKRAFGIMQKKSSQQTNMA